MRCTPALLVAALLLAVGQSRGEDERTARWLKQMDADGDGKLAREEARGAMRRNFERLDRNGDGVLDAAELDALAKRVGGRSRRVPSTEDLLASAPDDVTMLPDLAYREGDSKAWRLDLLMPRAKADKPRPAIVFVHGGGWRSGDKRSGTFLRGATEYAQKGYVCVTVNYRLVGEAPLPACIEDVQAAVRWLRANAKKYGVDPERIGAFGNSAGAHLVLMLGLATDRASRVQAVCAAAPPTDFSLFRGGGERLFGEVEDLEAAMAQASPLTHARKDVPPMLLIHGTADRTVDVKHSDVFFTALTDAGAKDVTLLRFDGAGHGVFNQLSAETHPAMEAFFARTLR